MWVKAYLWVFLFCFRKNCRVDRNRKSRRLEDAPAPHLFTRFMILNLTWKTITSMHLKPASMPCSPSLHAYDSCEIWHWCSWLVNLQNYVKTKLFKFSAVSSNSIKCILEAYNDIKGCTDCGSSLPWKVLTAQNMWCETVEKYWLVPLENFILLANKWWRQCDRYKPSF